MLCLGQQKKIRLDLCGELILADLSVDRGDYDYTGGSLFMWDFSDS